MKFDGYLFVSDMDATLLNDDFKVSKENQDAIMYFINNGGKFTIASGRMVAAAGAYYPQTHINAPAVLHNGAKLYDFENNRVLFEKFIEENRKQIIRKVYNNIIDVGIEIYANEIVYVYRSCKETARFKNRDYDVVYSLPEEIWNENWIKVLLIADKEKLNAYERDYRENYDSGYCVRSGDKYLDIMANGVSKGLGIKKLSELLGIKKDKIIAVGDNMNDISMFDYADISFAVENAEPAVKAAAKYRTVHYSRHAIAAIVEFMEKNI